MRRLPLVLAVLVGACGGSSQPTPLPCTYSTTASPAAFASAGGSGSVTVTTGGGCAWTARADASWLTVNGSGGTGAGTVTFAVAPNTASDARSGTMTVAGQVLAIQQEGAPVSCAFTIVPTTAAFGKDGGAGQVTVTTAAACAWTAAVENASWLSVATGGSGVGNGTVSFLVARNDSTSVRTATLRVAGQSVVVTQSGDAGACTYSVANVEFAPCMAASERETTVATQAGCTWTAAPDAGWLTIASGSSGAGSGIVRFRIAENWDAPRQGTVMIRWPTPTAGQNVRVAQAGCYYAVSRDSVAIPAAGGSATFDVIQQSEPYTCGGPLQNACVWSATADVGWISITGTMPRAGDDRVTFSVAPNTGPARTGTITIRSKTVRVTQAGA